MWIITVSILVESIRLYASEENDKIQELRVDSAVIEKLGKLQKMEYLECLIKLQDSDHMHAKIVGLLHLIVIVKKTSQTG